MTLDAIAVTGAAGFVGRHLCERFAGLGWSVRALMRDPARSPFADDRIRPFRCELPGELDAEALRGARAVVHCAYLTRHTSLDEARRVNDLGTRRVLDASRAAGVACFVFVSSLSAHDGATSYYGRSKLALEDQLDPERDLIVRPGLVLGREASGLFGRMCGWVRDARVIPLFGGGRQPLQTVLIDDLCDAFAAALAARRAGRYAVAEPEPVPLGEFLRALASQLDRRPRFVPVPLAPTLAALRACEALRIPLPVSSENLKGLEQLRAADTAADLETLGVRVRPYRESLEALWPRGAGA